MKEILRTLIGGSCAILLMVGIAAARPVGNYEVSPPNDGETYLVGDIDGTLPAPSKTLQDTVWIADWTLDGAGCVTTGWVKHDNRIVNDGSNYWTINNNFGGTGGIVDSAAVLTRHKLGWVADGYGNNWDYSIVLEYRGASQLTFSYLSDSEPGYDFVQVEADSAGASESRVDYSVAPAAGPVDYRTVLLSVDGLQQATVGPIGLEDFGVPATTHQVYIRFVSDGGYSDEDGNYTSFWSAGLIVDGISVTGDLNYSEDFQGPLSTHLSFVNTAPATPFGEWARVYQHITDNDVCTENTSCAWLKTDPLRTAFFPDMAFGPGSAVIRNWLDDIIVTPWVSLASTPSATGTIFKQTRFAGNYVDKGWIIQGWMVRGKVRIDNTDTSTPGDSIDAATPWAHGGWNSLGAFRWTTSVGDMSAFIDPSSIEVQMRFRTIDWQWYRYPGIGPPATLNPGPGPFIDRIRIGRRILSGPVFNHGIDTRSQGQDCYATVQNSITPGQHFSPAASDIFGSCAFSAGQDYGIIDHGPNLITGDSIDIEIVDARSAGGVAQVRWYGAISSGPHAGKAPVPYTVGTNGFFQVTPDSVRSPATGQVVADNWFVDLDDFYFRGGDALKYFWMAQDAAGGIATDPLGITDTSFPPASVTAAELATAGLFEVNYLPTINWSPAYLARIAADDHGDLEPTTEEIAASSHKNCILYYCQINPGNRRSGETNRTAFMYTLDRLGYRGYYDVYDIQGYGNTNNQLGGRANVPQCAGYGLIIQDTGIGASPNLPDGIAVDTERVNQAQWYRDYLAQGLTSGLGIASVWFIGEDTAFEKQTNPLISTDFGLASVVNDQGLNVNPNVVGQASFTFTTGSAANFASDLFALNGGCPSIHDYDAAGATGTAVVTHRYVYGTTTGSGATVMNKNTTYKWNTIWMGFGWSDIRNVGTPSSGVGGPDTRLARKILGAVLPLNCVRSENPTDTPGPEVDAVPAVSRLYQNVPNPFNPTTKVTFDLARDGHVRLQVFDVAGRLVKTLVDGTMTRGFNQTVTWNGLDEGGRRVPSGVYFYQLVTDEFTATRKMVMLK